MRIKHTHAHTERDRLTHNAFNQRRLPGSRFAHHVQMRPEIALPNPKWDVHDLTRVIHLAKTELDVE